jgi:hypothetical protein
LRTATDIFDSLKGSWLLDRTIIGSQKATATGTASFTPSAKNTLLYTEKGKLFGCDFHREYVYLLRNGSMEVHFCEDASPTTLFLALVFCPQDSLTTGSAHHLCKSDLYEMTYTFTDERTFQMFCKVIGPKKDYTILTTFRRSPDDISMSAGA